MILKHTEGLSDGDVGDDSDQRDHKQSQSQVGQHLSGIDRLAVHLCMERRELWNWDPGRYGAWNEV